MAKRSARWITGRFFLILCLATLVLAFVPATADASAVDSASLPLHEAEETLPISEGSPNSSQTVVSNEIVESVHHEDPVPLTNTRPLSNANSYSSKSSSTNVIQPIAYVQDSALETQSDTSKDDEKAKADSLLKASNDEQHIAFAVYDETSKTLSFHKQTAVPTKGSSFVGSDGKSRVASNVYEGIEDLDPDATAPWATTDVKSNVQNVVFVDTIAPRSLSSWFSGQGSLSFIDLSKLDTSNATSMAHMFNSCTNLTNIDVSHFVTDNVTNLTGIFKNCASLRSLNVSHFNTSNVTLAASAFANCTSLKSLEVNAWDVSKITRFDFMFNGCASLTELNLSNWKTSSMEVLTAMFLECSSLKVLDLSSFDTSSLQLGLARLFKDCTELTTIYVGEKWILSDSLINSAVFPFENCGKLVGCMGTVLDLEAALKNKRLFQTSYAHIDGGPNNPGYLSTHAIPVGQVVISGMETVSWDNGQIVSPKPVLTIGNRMLVEGVDYTLQYTQATRYGRHSVTIVGLGDFNGTFTKTYDITYNILPSGPETKIVWASSRDTVARVRSEWPLDTFKELLIDGKVVDESNYVATSGSTIIELTPEYLTSLSLGEHTISIVSENGVVTGTFTLVDENSQEDPGSEPVNPDPATPNPTNPDPEPVIPANPVDANPETPATSTSAGSAQGSQNASNSTTGTGNSSSSGIGNATGSQDESVTSTKTYSFLSGANATHELGSGKSLVLRADGELSDFVSVLVDGEELDSMHFTTKAGSTIVTIDPEYLDTLPEGDHKLTLRFKDGEATTHFTVRDGSEDEGASAGPAEEEPSSEGVRPVKTQAKHTAGSRSETPDTGDGDMTALLLLMIACVLGFCGIRKSISL